MTITERWSSLKVFRIPVRECAIVSANDASATFSAYEAVLQRLQRQADAGQCTKAQIQQRDELEEATAKIKRTMQDTRHFDRDLGQVFASSGLRTRTTPIGTSNVDWALIRIPEERLGTNLVRNLHGASA